MYVLDEDKNDYKFASYSTIIHPENSMIPERRKEGGDRREEKCNFANKKENKLVGSLKDLHRRLGHISTEHLRALEKSEFVQIKGGPCDACSMGRIKREGARHPGKFLVAGKAGEGVHVDAIGPCRTETIGGKRYALFLTDSYSSYHVCCLLRTKDEQAECLNKWKKNQMEQRKLD